MTDAPGCPCCSGRAGPGGFLYEGEDARAIYYYEHIGVGKLIRLHVGLVWGEWGSGADKTQRVSMAFSVAQRAAGGFTAIPPVVEYAPEFAELGETIAADAAPAHPRYGDVVEGLAQILREDPMISDFSDGPPVRRFVAD